MLSFLPLVPLTVFGTWLAMIDLKTHRLPNRIVGWFTLVELATLGALSWAAIDFGQFLIALGTALASMGMYLLLYLLSRGALGMGDVKFAFPLGLCVGWYAAGHWLVAIFVSFGLAGFVAITGLVFKQMNRKSRLAFGPYMFVGTLLCLVAELVT